MLVDLITTRCVSEGFLADSLPIPCRFLADSLPLADASGYVRTKELAVMNKIKQSLPTSATSTILAVARKPTQKSNLNKGLALCPT